MSQQPPDRPSEGWQPPPQQQTQPLPGQGQQPPQQGQPPQWGPPGQQPQPGWGPPPQPPMPRPKRPWYFRWWAITGYVLVGLLVLGSLVGEDPTPTVSPASTTLANDDPGRGGGEPLPISGRGKTATKTFRVSDGMAIFRFQHQGSSNFIVGLLTSRGEEIDGLVNEIGTINGSTARGIEAGRYLFNVEADGPWSIRIEQPRPGSGRGLPATARGRGHSVAGPFQATGAGVRFELRHRGESNFIVDVLDVDGQDIGNLTNEIGSFEGSTVGEVPEGVFWLNVQADGSWTITMREL
jgi:hypothetical protein